MSFGQIGSLKPAYQRIKTAGQAQQFDSQKQSVEKVLEKFREVGQDLVSLNDTTADKLADDPRKVAAQRGETSKPRFEKSVHQTAFKVARVLFPPLSLLDAETFDKPSLSGVATLNEKSQPTQLNAKVGSNPDTGESRMELDYQIADDGTERYQMKTFTPVTVADAWFGDEPLGLVRHAALPRTETVEVKDGEFSYSTEQARISSRATHLDLFEAGLTLK